MTTAPVHSITDEQIAEIEALASKATPGEWWIDSHGHRMTAGPFHETVFIADDRIGKASRHHETGNLSHWPNDWDASYIAAACPANIIALITRLREAEKDAARYRWLRDRGDAYQWENILGFDLDDFMMEDDALGHAIDVYMQEHTQ